MASYTKKITLTKNGRGVWCLDSSMGCGSGIAENPRGCYSDCYAYRAAKARGFDFSKTVFRFFSSYDHRNSIVEKLNSIDMPFVRLGCSGDPSENWEHSLAICADLRGEYNRDFTQLGLFSEKRHDYLRYNGGIVLITRHWKTLTDGQLLNVESLNLCINTSVSALDSESDVEKSLTQYKRLKPFCKSVLRVITCDFNTDTPEGSLLFDRQSNLLKNEDVIETVFRPSSKNPFLIAGLINATRGKFNSGKQVMSRRSRFTFTGKCGQCAEKCGVGKMSKIM